MSRAIRVDAEVRAELERRRHDGERLSDVVARVAERYDLERRMRDFGLGPVAYARLLDLRAMEPE